MADGQKVKPAGAAAAAEEGELPVDDYGLPVYPHKTLGKPVIQLRGIRKTYNLPGGERVQALRSINLHDKHDFFPVREGEFVMIRGPSGGGKTTLLNIVGLIDTPSTGRVELFGDPIDPAKASDDALAAIRLAKIGYIFQSYNLLATLSAYENVEMPMTMLGKLRAADRRERVTSLLRAVGMEDRMAHLPSEMSGGEQQRATIARALANDPQLLIGDEVTAALDTRNTVEIMDLLLRINQQQGVTILMVTHNSALECYADRCLYVEDGAFVHQAINAKQSRLDVDQYVAYLEHEAAVGPVQGGVAAEEGRLPADDPPATAGVSAAAAAAAATDAAAGQED